MNLAIHWEARSLHLKTDSLCVYKWLTNTLTGKARVSTKAACEMLVRRRLQTFSELVKEYALVVDVALVRSNQNKADMLTRVPQRWLEAMRKEAEPVLPMCAAAADSMEPSQIRQIHSLSGHPGVKRTTYFVRKIAPFTSKEAVRAAIRSCCECLSIDPAPIRWKKGRLESVNTWQRLGMDVTHYEGAHYLTLIDCGPTRFAVWRPLRLEDSAAVIQCLNSIFFERGPPEEILTDNATAFTSRSFRAFAESWGVHLRFRCAYKPSGNGIAERSHRSIKRIAARKRCTIQEAVYWYNVAPKDGIRSATAPANALYQYEVRVKGVDKISPLPAEFELEIYKKGDVVLIADWPNKCTSEWKTGIVTELVSPQTVCVDGVPRHVRDLRPFPNPVSRTVENGTAASSDDEICVMVTNDGDDHSADDSDDSDDQSQQIVMALPQGESEPALPRLRRSSRRKRPPDGCYMCDEIRGECSGNNPAVPEQPSKRTRLCLACLDRTRVLRNTRIEP